MLPKRASRLYNSTKNICAVIVCQIINLVLQFFLRTVFVRCFSSEYLGLNGLFTNILSLLSLSELGLGHAVVFSLYGPVVRNEHQTINAIMEFYKKAYTCIGICILFLGCILTPFLPWFIKEVPDIPYLQVIYLMYVINTAESYFFSFRQACIIANQKNYMLTMNHCIWKSLNIIVQCIILLVLKNYYLYLLCQLIFTLAENISISKMAVTVFPYLKEKPKGKISNYYLDLIVNNTKALVFHKIGSMVVFSSDNILLSKLFGVMVVGIYSNYTLIFQAIDSVISQFFTAITASVGNLRQTGSVEHQKLIFYVIQLVGYAFYLIITLLILNVLNPVIEVWIGSGYLLSYDIITILAINTFMAGMRRCLWVFNDSLGLHVFYKYMPVPESIINIAASVFLGKMWGVIGIFIGTLISSLSTCFWIEPKVLFKHGFGENTHEYWHKYCKYIVGGTAACACVIPLSGFLISLSRWNIIFAAIANVIVGIIFTIIVSWNTEEANYIKSILRRGMNNMLSPVLKGK